MKYKGGLPMKEIKAMSPEMYLDKQIALKKELIIDKVNKELESYASHPTYSWVELIIDGDYSTTVRNEVAKDFVAAGWKKVYHHTSSENGERSGLTSFILLTEETVDKWEQSHNKDKFWCVSEKDL